MIIIVEPYARYTSTLAATDLERAARNLLQFAEESCQSYFTGRYEGLKITVVTRVEIGSTRTWVTIASLASALTFYGNIRQSIDYLVKDGQHLGRIILSGIPISLGIEAGPVERQENRLGLPGQLQRLFTRVDRGEISVDHATSHGVRLLQTGRGVDLAHEAPTVAEQLSAEFERAARRGRVGLAVGSGDVATGREVPAGPQTPKAPRPDMSLPPTTPRQRLKGAIASRDPRTGDVDVSNY